MDNIDLSTVALLAHRAKAEAATPGTWVEKILPDGDFDDDATFVTTQVREDASKIEIAKLENASPYDDDPNEFILEQRANAAHIAANSPVVVMAHVDEILRLRAEVERMEKEADWLAARLATALRDIDIVDSFHGLPEVPRHYPSSEMLRENARKAVEEQCKS